MTCNICFRNVESHYNHNLPLKDQCPEVQSILADICSDNFFCPLCRTTKGAPHMELTVDGFFECISCHSLFTDDADTISEHCGIRVQWNLLPKVVGGRLVVQVDKFGNSDYLRNQIHEFTTEEYIPKSKNT